jgi:hypothetical protein
MGVLRVTNNAWGNLSTALSASGGTLTLQTGQGARFPAIAVGSGDWFYLNIFDANGNTEQVKVTYALGDQFGVVRAMDGTTAINWQAGVRVELRPTRAAWNDLQASFLYAMGEGMTMTGMLTLNGDPTTPAMAATKQYADANALPLTTALEPPIGYKPVYNTGTDRVQLAYTGSAITLSHSGTLLGNLWTSGNFNPAGLSPIGGQIVWAAGPYMAGMVSTRVAATVEAGNPWVVEGMYQDGGSFNYYGFYPRYAWFRNP